MREYGVAQFSHLPQPARGAALEIPLLQWLLVGLRYVQFGDGTVVQVDRLLQGDGKDYLGLDIDLVAVDLGIEINQFAFKLLLRLLVDLDGNGSGTPAPGLEGGNGGDTFPERGELDFKGAGYALLAADDPCAGGA